MPRIQSIASGAVIAIVAVAAGLLLSRTAAPSGPVLANGALRALFTAPYTPDGLASDFRRLTQTPSDG